MTSHRLKRPALRASSGEILPCPQCDEVGYNMACAYCNEHRFLPLDQ